MTAAIRFSTVLRPLLAVGLLLPAFALADVQLVSAAFQEKEVVVNGKKSVKREPLANAVPGQEIIYVITYRNTGNEPVQNVVVNNPVPKELSYVANSALGNGTRFEASVDGGKTFGVFSQLSVKGTDGKPRAANGGDVTNLRWTLTTPLKAAGEGDVSYRAVLR
ncbi:MAG: hypothetical protein REI12_05820 [Pedobacter sp.]|nr:hypothetical protein [Pedobacter sp.]